MRAVFEGLQTRPNPTDRGKPGSKRRLICDGRGISLITQLAGGNPHDSQQALAAGGCDSTVTERAGTTTLLFMST